MELYEVGGCVRDEIMGVKSKDIDYSVVLHDFDIEFGKRWSLTPFQIMKDLLELQGYDIKVEKPEYLTIRAIFPKGHKYRGGADFVLARKEADYSDGRRPDAVIPGTLQDDLARRDFTMNAIAKAADGTLIDPFGGVDDINDKIIRAVGSAEDRIMEDALRGMRALRFAVTKGFSLHYDVVAVLSSKEFVEALSLVSIERVQDELEKMFNADTIHSLFLIDNFNLTDTLFSNTGLRLMPTMKG
jgi:tRNA nucleotidyltransferase/poly(A) polymerase